jgi:hypothetical protein
VYDTRTTPGHALQHRLALLARDLRYQRETVASIGTLGGLAVEASATRRTTGVELTLRCRGVPHTAVETTVESLGDDSKAVGLVTRLENRINALEHRRDETAEEIGRLEVEVSRAQDRIGAEFPQAGGLSAAKLRAADIEARLTEAAAYKPPAADPNNDHSPAPADDVDDEPEHEPQ